MLKQKTNQPLILIKNIFTLFIIGLLFLGCGGNEGVQKQPSSEEAPPNIVLIYADDLGYGDLSSYGGEIQTPNIDELAQKGVKHLNAYATAAICTPSRYSLLTGEYSWRQIGNGVASGNDGALIRPGKTTLPGILQKAGYQTAVVGKWHLGLGNSDGPDWNGKIAPGPLEIGFDYSFIIPATGDRVPTVYVENHHILNLDPNDPIQVSYDQKIGSEPTGSERPDLLKMNFSHGHNHTIVNGISRIGYQSGGKSAWWKDEDFADQFVKKSSEFMEENKDTPFFLFLPTHDIHVPRVPHQRFVGKSGRGPRGDALLQLDWTVGAITEKLEDLNILDNTLIVFTSDNGPVTDDGYEDQADELLGNHLPAAHLRGGKYSSFEAGTKIPLILSGPGINKPGTSSEVLLSQLDFLRSFAALTGQSVPETEAIDSYQLLNSLLGTSQDQRPHHIQLATGNGLSFIMADYKYIVPNNGSPKVSWGPDIETGFSKEDQLYHLKTDPTETHNIASEKPEILEKMKKEFERIRNQK